ncbi:porin [Cognatiluteimonas profundi]|uniref:porin n=1 Tax=Cognatiluteimonas profundi TaxID=2594501 RepID=UPI00131C5F68|nr:porin [Lysobacter profundi]
MRYNMLTTAIAAGLGLATVFVANPVRAANASTQPTAVTAEQLQDLKAQIASLQAQLDTLQQRTDAQSDINVATAQSTEAAQATQDKLDKLAKVVNDTQLNGKMFFDMTNIDQQDNGNKTSASGTGFDVKRFYLSVTHQFDPTWSANLTTDFQYSSSLDSAADIYVKKAYLQGKFSDAFVVRAGSADLPWIPFAENYYGFRYVENTLTDRLKFGTSADWGVHAGGDLAGKKVNYAVSMVNGAGYKNPTRSNSMDVEGRVGFVPFDGMVVAVGAYSGKLGKDTQNVDTLHTAQRGDLMVAYAKGPIRVGGEYFNASNWNNVLTAASDKADGYSLWGSLGLGSGGITAFARYDRSNLSKDLDPSLTDTYYNLGVEFPLRKGVKLAAAYKHDQRKNDTAVDLKTQEFGIWGEVAF